MALHRLSVDCWFHGSHEMVCNRKAAYHLPNTTFSSFKLRKDFSRVREKVSENDDFEF
jgi:hypothetical protein